jgi:hypothetical protein
MIGYISHCNWDLSSCNSSKPWGGFYNLPADYIGNYNNMIYGFSTYYNNNFQLILEREKILRPAYGQSSRYETEYTPSELANKSIRPSYGFNTVNGSIYQDSEGTKGRVLYAGGTPGYFVKDLYENLEQVNVIDNSTNNNSFNLWYNMGDKKNNEHKWFVKPRMRIDSTFAANNLDTPVVAVITKNFDGHTIDSTVISCRNFGKRLFNVFYYNNGYVEQFYVGEGNTNNIFFINVKADDLLEGTTSRNGFSNPELLNECKVDYQVYWFGKVDVWLDYVKVEDEWAHYLLTDPLLLPQYTSFRDKVNLELDAIYSQSNFNTVPYFYLDEFCYNNIPCIAFVDSLIKLRNPSSGLVVLLNDWWTRSQTGGGLRNGPVYADKYDYMINSSAIDSMLLTEIYPFDEAMPLPASLNFSINPDEFPATDGYRKANNNNDYADTLNYFLERGYAYSIANNSPGIVPSFMDRFRKCAFSLKNRNLKTLAIAVPFHVEETMSIEQMREPTLEEMSLMCYLSLAYGANSIFEFSYPSKMIDPANKHYAWGIASLSTGEGCDENSDKRIYNYYGQLKWDGIVKIDSIIKRIGDYIYSPTKGKLIYDDTRTINTKFGSTNDGTLWGLPFKYITDIMSVYYNPQNGGYNSSNTDPSEKRYWEFGFFNPRQNDASDKSKYLLAVNKRCAPGDRGTGDHRLLKIKFSASQLAGFNNWMLMDAVSDSVITVFDKNLNEYVIAGEFMPGEGKLFKIVPVMQEGGTFVCDEEVSPITFDCDSTVYNDGYDLRLYQGTKIMFRSKGKIVFNRGDFHSGLIPENQSVQATEFCGYNGGYWEGISFENTASINMTGSIIKDIAYEPPGGMNPVIQNCAVSMTNCRNFCITGNTFNLNNKSGAVYFQFISDENPNWQNTYIAGNNFILGANNTGEPVVLSFNSLAAGEMPLRIKNNFFHNNSSTNALAVSINGIAGGIIKNNCINRFACGIAALASSIDLYNNMIYTNSQSSKSVEGTYASNINISPNFQYYTGGFNNFISAYEDSRNINLDNSYLFLEGGNNHFNISSYPQNGVKPYHIYGTFPGNPYDVYPASDNCFKIDSLYDDPVAEVTANGNPVVFNFFSYSCSAMQPEDYAVFTSPGIVNDTVAVVNEGMGGSVKGNGENMPETQISPCKSLLDSININMRKRQYSSAEIQCRRMLTLYPDSIACFDAMNKLYLASLSQDSAGIKMQTLKAFYETVILNNQGKINLINRCFYLIQKCKVALKQYSAAMEGFQLIIQQNPYTYEGLAASWDYAAAYLLDSINGQGGGLSNRETEKRLSDFDIRDRYDSTRFTKSQRNDITKSIDNAIENRRVTQTEKIAELQKKSEKGDREAGKELRIMKTINETVKTKKPNSNIELRQIIQSDIRKVFIRSGENSKEPAVLIPKTFELYQNYPNPFNPTTKIAFDLPKDARVKLVIYDILGREVRTLINNEFRTAGKYISEFNGSQLASGIYFARILVNDGKEFVGVKKMVLIK